MSSCRTMTKSAKLLLHWVFHWLFHWRRNTILLWGPLKNSFFWSAFLSLSMLYQKCSVMSPSTSTSRKVQPALLYWSTSTVIHGRQSRAGSCFHHALGNKKVCGLILSMFMITLWDIYRARACACLDLIICIEWKTTFISGSSKIQIDITRQFSYLNGVMV